MSFEWTDKSIARLKKLWREGHSCSQIASMMGGLSRSAVIGKVRRLELSKRRGMSDAVKRKAKKKMHPRPVRPVISKVRLEPEPLPDTPDLFIPETDRMHILIKRNGKIYANEDMTPDRCRWPIGDPQHADFHFCGKAKVAGLSYCHHHAIRAYPGIAIETRSVASETNREKELA